MNSFLVIKMFVLKIIGLENGFINIYNLRNIGTILEHFYNFEFINVER